MRHTILVAVMSGLLTVVCYLPARADASVSAS